MMDFDYKVDVRILREARDNLSGLRARLETEQNDSHGWHARLSIGMALDSLESAAVRLKAAAFDQEIGTED